MNGPTADFVEREAALEEPVFDPFSERLADNGRAHWCESVISKP